MHLSSSNICNSKQNNGILSKIRPPLDNIEKIKEEFIKGYDLILTLNHSSYNTVEIYVKSKENENNTYPKKIAVRLSKTPSIINNKIAIDSNRNNYNNSNITGKKINEINNSFDNWMKASDEELVPEILFYGYCNTAEIPNDYYLCIVSEAYDIDLYNYYNQPKSKIKPKYNILIQQQLTSLLDNKIDKLQHICVEFKITNWCL